MRHDQPTRTGDNATFGDTKMTPEKVRRPIDNMASPEYPVPCDFIPLQYIGNQFAVLQLRTKKTIYFIPHPDLSGSIYVTTRLSDGSTFVGKMDTTTANDLFPAHPLLQDHLKRGMRLRINPNTKVEAQRTTNGLDSTYTVEAVGLVNM